MTHRIHRLRSNESGFTLIEMLVAMTVGLVVMMAALLLLDRATSVSQEVSNRQDALQRGRLAMETIVRDLRSQVCLGDEKEPIKTAENSTVTFYADLSDGSRDPEQRTIRYDSTTKTIYEDIYTGTGIYPELVYNEAPTTRVLVSGVEPILDGGVERPVFRYYAFNPGGVPGDLLLLPATPALDTDDAIRTVMVKVGFTVLPDRKTPQNREATTLESDIYVRIADPSRPLEGPACV